APRSTGAAISPGAAAASALAEVARRRGELPADAGARHLAATRPVVLLGRVLLGAELEAAQAARLVAIAPVAARPAAVTAAPAAVTAAPAAVTAAPVVAA